jgi:5-methylcytosine-specific restriction endonuclease McrA
MDYESYINSAQWRDSAARLGELEAANFRCRICNGSEPDVQLQVHHRTYERLGHERVGDLTTLCMNCHGAVTDMLRRRRYSNRRPIFHDAAIANCTVPLFDPTTRGDWS